jgi:hypothetical protein
MRIRYHQGYLLGFTLTELLIAMATSGLLLGTIVSSFIAQQKSYNLSSSRFGYKCLNSGDKALLFPRFEIEPVEFVEMMGPMQVGEKGWLHCHPTSKRPRRCGFICPSPPLRKRNVHRFPSASKTTKQ